MTEISEEEVTRFWCYLMEWTMLRYVITFPSSLNDVFGASISGSCLMLPHRTDKDFFPQRPQSDAKSYHACPPIGRQGVLRSARTHA